MLEVRVHPRRGRGLYTTRRVLGGETVLAEAPLLLSVPSAMFQVACATCLRANQGGQLLCPGCNQASYCSPECAQLGTANPWVHGAGVCSTYRALASCVTSNTAGAGASLDEQDLDAGRFLAHVLALQGAALTDTRAAAAAAALQSLQGTATDVEQRLVEKLTPVLQAVAQGPLPLTAGQMADLLRKEQCNSYGMLAPAWYTDQQKQQQKTAAAAQSGAIEEEEEGCDRVLRGSALYGLASLINHECNPNVARFDSFDVPGPASTHVVFKAMHDLPPGTEVLQSYCPLAWDFGERQEHCQSVYGFSCTCQRCKLEQTWCLDDTAGGQGMDTDDAVACAGAHAGMDESGSSLQIPTAAMQPVETVAGLISFDAQAAQFVKVGAGMLPVQAEEGDQEPLEDGYLQLYLLKYMCPEPGCYGTLAPQAPASDMFECSVCGAVRSEAQFMAGIEAYYA